MWINCDTGEVQGFDVEKRPEDGDFVWDDSVALPSERQDLCDDQDEWLPDWYLTQELHDDAEEAADKIQTALRAKRRKGRRAWRKFAWEPRLAARVLHDRDNQKGKAKSVNYTVGKCGWTTSTNRVVDDKKAAMAYAVKSCREAIKITPSLLKSAFPEADVEAGKVPGVTLVTGDTFWARPTKPKAAEEPKAERPAKDTTTPYVPMAPKAEPKKKTKTKKKAKAKKKSKKKEEAK